MREFKKGERVVIRSGIIHGSRHPWEGEKGTVVELIPQVGMYNGTPAYYVEVDGHRKRDIWGYYLKLEMNIGDRVEHLVRGGVSTGPPLGTQGTIVKKIGDGFFGVEWDNYTMGHSCKGATSRRGSGWNVTDANIKLIEKSDRLPWPGKIMGEPDLDALPCAICETICGGRCYRKW